MKIQSTLSFVALLAGLCLQPLASADVKSGSGKSATGTGDLVDCFYEQNAGNAACQQFRDSKEKNTATKDAPVSNEGRIAKRVDKNSSAAAAP